MTLLVLGSGYRAFGFRPVSSAQENGFVTPRVEEGKYTVLPLCPGSDSAFEWVHFEGRLWRFLAPSPRQSLFFMRPCGRARRAG